MAALIKWVSYNNNHNEFRFDMIYIAVFKMQQNLKVPHRMNKIKKD